MHIIITLTLILVALPERLLAIDIVVDTADVSCKDFAGFGAEWDSYSYLDSSISGQDRLTEFERLDYMMMPIIRIMMCGNWCYQGGGFFDWNTPSMKELYRHLDYCQLRGTKVVLTDWGLASWAKPVEVKNVDDTLYASIIAKYMDYLIRQRYYTCIKYFVLVNEPNYEVLAANGKTPFEIWQKGVLNVDSVFKFHGMDTLVSIMGSDQSNADDWHIKAVDSLHKQLNAYDVHRYANWNDVKNGLLEPYFANLWNYSKENDSFAYRKPLMVAEAGRNDLARHPYGNVQIDNASYGVFMADYAVQAVRAGSHAVLAWMASDNSHKNFYWGLWKDSNSDLELRPWFYAWSLLSRHFPTGSKIFRTNGETYLRTMAARTINGRWSFFIVNMNNVAKTINITLPENMVQPLKRYLYNESNVKSDYKGFPVHLETITTQTGILTTSCPAASVVLLTNYDVPSVDVHEDTIKPIIRRITALTPTTIDVYFSEIIDSATAVNIMNYSLSDGASIQSAVLGKGNYSVRLTTSSEMDLKNYEIGITGIADLFCNTINDTTTKFANQAAMLISDLTIASGKTYEWTSLSDWMPPYVNTTGSQLVSNPQILKGLRFLKTSSEDKAYTDSAFMSFNVDMDVEVYIIKPSGTLPGWMSGFEQMTYKSFEWAAERIIYRKIFPAGSVTLGGGENKSNMYNVLVRALPEGNSTAVKKEDIDNNPLNFIVLPNPFNPSLNIRYAISQNRPVFLNIYSMNGALVRTFIKQVMGSDRVLEIVWDGRDDNGISVSSGTYIVNIRSGNKNQYAKVVLMK